MLDAGPERALTLVAAPAGWGKSVLLAGWAADHGAAWLTLAPGHADPARFWADVLTSLRRAGTALEGLEPPGTALDDGFSMRLADELAAAPERPVIVLDDLQCIRGAAIAALGELLALGDGLHVVGATRSDPDLPLARLRLAGRLGEVRAADLAFTPQEGAAMLSGLGLSLRDDQLERLVQRTEGWAAGLRLAGLSLAGEHDPDAFVAEFAGDDRAVADYLTDEVLALQPATLRRFLLRTSVAERLCGGLADALTGGDGGARVLQELEHAGMFVSALDRHRTWFRYHGLFAELLRTRLRLEHPGLEPELHARAAGWLAAHGGGREAVPHAIAAGPAGGAARLLADHWLELMLGGPAPEAVIAAADRPGADAALALAAASASLSLGDAAGAEARLDVVGDRADGVGRLAALLRARAGADVAGARRAAGALLDRPGAPAPEGDALRALALFHLGVAEFAGGPLEAAAEDLEAAAAIAVERGREGLRLGCLGRMAALEVAAGRLTRGAGAARAAIVLAETCGWQRTAAAAWAYAALAVTQWHRDELDDAERRADAAATAAYASRETAATTAVRALRAHLAAARDDVVQARGLLRAVRDALPESGPVAARWVDALGPAPWMPEGDAGPLGEATDWLARGDPLAALRRVDGLADADSAAPPVLRLHAWLLDALARQGLGRLDAAAQSLEHALALAAGEGYRRPFVAGLPVRRLLERHVERPTAYGPFVAELLEALERQDGGATPGVLEPLSERERAVLRLLPTLLSYPEIAGELFVSVNTVKTHVKGIYRKLDVTSRRAAVVRARGLRLL
jgi:LuxR family maltose regulon positive regulatory protein